MRASSLQQEILVLRAKTEGELLVSNEEIHRLEEENYFKELRILEVEREIANLEGEKSFGSIASLSATELKIYGKENGAVQSLSSATSPGAKRRWSLKHTTSRKPESQPSPTTGHRRSLSWSSMGQTKIITEEALLEDLSWIEHGTKIMIDHAKQELACQEEQVTALEMTSHAQEEAIYDLRDRLLSIRESRGAHGSDTGVNTDDLEERTSVLREHLADDTEQSRQLAADLKGLKEILSLDETKTSIAIENLQTATEESKRKIEFANAERIAKEKALRDELETAQEKLQLIEIESELHERVGLKGLRRISKKLSSEGDPLELSSILLRASRALNQELEFRRDVAPGIYLSRLIQATGHVKRQVDAILTPTEILVAWRDSFPRVDLPPDINETMTKLLRSASASLENWLPILGRVKHMLETASNEYRKDDRLLPARLMEDGQHMESPVPPRNDIYEKLLALRLEATEIAHDIELQEMKNLALSCAVQDRQQDVVERQAALKAKIESLQQTVDQQTKLWDVKDSELQAKLKQVERAKHRNGTMGSSAKGVLLP